MATITPVLLSEAYTAAHPFAPTAVTGDEIAVASSGDSYLIEFNNTHTSPVTADVVPAVTSFNQPGIGKVSKAALSQAIANATMRSVLIPAGVVNQYLNANSRIPITYTGGNVALLIRAYRIPAA